MGVTEKVIVKRQVSVRWEWTCPLCRCKASTFSNSEPRGWTRLWGLHMIPIRTFKEGECCCPDERREEIICPSCTYILRRAFETLEIIFEFVPPNVQDYSKPISLGILNVMA